MRVALPELIPDRTELDYVQLRLGQLLGVELASSGPALSREELFAGWRLFLERLVGRPLPSC